MVSILPCCLPFGNAGELQLLCCQGFEVNYYDVTLDALNLKPSDVCNVGVDTAADICGHLDEISATEKRYGSHLIKYFAENIGNFND